MFSNSLNFESSDASVLLLLHPVLRDVRVWTAVPRAGVDARLVSDPRWGCRSGTVIHARVLDCWAKGGS